MNELIERAFEKMGSRVKVEHLEDIPRNKFLRRPADPPSLRIDVRKDKKGEFFRISKSKNTEVVVLDVNPADRHLLLMSKNDKGKHRFLAGHDERHWFVAAIPEATPISTVKDAKSVLKPESIRRADVIRQGEWFFVPAYAKVINENLVLHDEPLIRGRGSKPHMCQDLFRIGGVSVYVNADNPNGITESAYAKLSKETLKNGYFRLLRRDPKVFVRGAIKHTDHKTIVLNGWHEVMMNTENQAEAMKNVAFLD